MSFWTPFKWYNYVFTVIRLEVEIKNGLICNLNVYIRFSFFIWMLIIKYILIHELIIKKYIFLVSAFDWMNFGFNLNLFQ